MTLRWVRLWRGACLAENAIYHFARHFRTQKTLINKSIIIKSVETSLIQTERFLLKTLTEEDVSDRYLGWLNNEGVRSFITAAKRT